MNKIFNPSLYKDCMKQLRTLGIIGLILTIGSTFINANEVIKWARYADGYLYYNSSCSEFYIINFILVVVIFTPLLTFTMYDFLNKRNGSDYYHSFPCKRSCLYITMFGSIFTWILAMSYLPMISTVLIYGINGYHFPVGRHLAYLTAIFVAALLVMSVTSLSCAVTGNRFTSVISTGLILFLPTFILCSLGETILNYSVVITENSLPDLFTHKLNIIFYMLTVNTEQLPIYLYIITIIVSIAAAALGLLCFVKRPSETAGKSTFSKFMHGVYRISIGLSLMVFSNVVVFVENTVTILYVLFFAFAAMLIFEYFSTKSGKSLLKVIPAMVILVASYILYLLVGHGMAHLIVSNGPDPKNTTELSINMKNIELDMSPIPEFDTNDKEVIRIINDYYKSNLKNEKGEDYYYIYDSWYGCDIVYTKNGIKHERQVSIPINEMDSLFELIANKCDYKFDLNFSADSDVHVMINGNYVLDDTFSRGELREILLKEAKESLTTKDILNMSCGVYNSGKDPYVEIVEGKDTVIKRLGIRITDKLPKTQQYLKEHMLDADAEIEVIID